MRNKSFLTRTLSLLSLIFLMLSIGQLQAKTEYVVGLTTGGLRAASLEEVELGFNYQLSQSTKDKNYSIKIKVYPNNQLLLDALTTDKVMGYFGPPLLYIQHKASFNDGQLYSPALNNQVMQRYLLLVRSDTGITQLADLKKTDISYCLTDEVGVFYLQKLLKDKKQGQLTAFFNKMVVKKNPSMAISAVFFKETKATLVLESDFIVATELNPQLKKQLIAIETSPEYITNLLAVKKNLSGPMTPELLQQHVFDTGINIKNKMLLKSYNFNELRKIKERDLESVDELIRFIEKFESFSR
jgi:ABC-type phosphate/phosphonate transport system substrate-binding protein